MTAYPSYSTGTVAVAASGTVVTGSGTIWSGINVRAGDNIVIAGNTVTVVDVTDTTHLVIDAWPYAAVPAGTAYKVYQKSPLRFAGGQAMADVATMVGALNTDGFYVFVPSTATVPDTSYGNNGQYAFQASTGKLWQKVSGAWSYIGIYKAFGTPAPWSATTAYNPSDVATLAGSSYVCILAHTNFTPPNATYWAVLAAVGQTGATGATGAVPFKPIVAWATATAYVVGPPSDYVSQGGSSYQCLVAHTSGTFATDFAAGKWGLVAQKGVDGTGTGTVTSVTVGGTTITTAGTLPAVAYDAAQALTAAQQSQARANLGAMGKNRLFNGQFMIDQRYAGTSGSPANNTYGADRWRLLTEGAAVTAVIGSGRIDSGKADYGVQMFDTTSKFGLLQVIEGVNCRDLRGKSVVFSGRLLVSAVALSNMKAAILEWTGAQDATTASPISTWNVDGTNPTLAANWAYKNTPVSLGSFTAAGSFSVTATLGTTFNNLAVLVWSDVKTHGNGDYFVVTDTQIEVGSVASAFEFTSFQAELARCLPYYQKSYDIGSLPGAVTRNGLVSLGNSGNGTNNVGLGLSLSMTMRAAPAISTWDGAGAAGKVSYYNASAWTDGYGGPTNMIAVGTKSAILTISALSGVPSFLHYSATAEI